MSGIVTDQYRLILLVSAWITLLYNGSFFARLAGAFPPEQGNSLFIAAVGLLLFLVLVLLFSVAACRYVTRPMLMLSVVTAALCSYYMSEYGIIIDITMLQNIAETNNAEAAGLVSPELIIRFLLLGILPALLILKWKIIYHSAGKEVIAKVSLIVLTLVATGILLMSFSASFTTFFREYKSVRYYTNPVTAFYSGIQYLGAGFAQSSRPDHPEIVSSDAHIADNDGDAAGGRPDRELVILVVGEASRADRFQLNGYTRETNPQLSRVENLVSFSQVTSCGTSTAVSVPCMFLKNTRKEFNSEDIYSYENVLDVLVREGINVIWRDNNSSSKGVADRVEHQNYRSPDVNPLCDRECRDTGMLSGLQQYVDSHTEGDILIVLHQMGNHGHEYYKRYPGSFEHFRPACKTNKLGECSVDEVNNAYDNAIRYTDYFLAKTIQFLKANDSRFEAAMLYVGDHGESLGENGFYLHGLPYAIAPEVQKHVATVVWVGRYFDIGIDEIRGNENRPFSHDNLYCTLLGMFEVETADCSPGSSMLFADSIQEGADPN